MLRRPFALALTALALMGCQRTLKDRIQGRWNGIGIEGAPSSKQANAAGWVNGLALEFAGTKATVSIPAEASRTGTFKVGNVQGDRFHITFHRPEGTIDESEFRLIDENKLAWRVGDATEVLLRKEIAE